ncbi:MAG: NAD(P)-dependent oxidoreductase [Deltaproteobacteria bacterium]|nr:MAG: NAD(P)-dependent oxidoreductase [Deltaproteobacteria bacterium]
MNVLITGGTGFIGSRLALRCLEQGFSVTVLGQVNNETEEQNKELISNKGAKIVLASVTERAKIFESLSDIDIVYHLAAAQHEANVPDQHFWDVNVEGTRNVLEASVSAQVKRFIHGSTIGVYGSALEGSISEQTPLRPDNIYGVTKLEGEKLVLAFEDKLPVVVIRISETYGPGDRRLLKLFKAIKKNSFFMIGDGKNLHHPIYIDDLIDGLLLAATVEVAAGQVFLLAGKEAITTNDMVATIAEQEDTKLRRFRAPLLPFLILATIAETILRPLGIQPPLHRRRMDFFKKSFIFSNEQSLKTLGFSPHYTFKQGVTETARWYAEMGYL